MQTKFFVLAVLIGTAFLAMTTSTFAYFKVCNKSSKASIDVAYAHQTRNKEWLSEGWWTIKHGECVTLIGGRLRSQYYYLYGKSDGSIWEADESQEGGMFCTKNEKFTLPQDLDCEKAGFDEHRFIEINTDNYDDFTHNLND